MAHLASELEAILEAAASAIEDCGNPVPSRQFVNPGQNVAFDSLDCEAGLLYVRIIRIFPYDTFPVHSNAFMPCAKPLGCHFAVGIMRCQSDMDAGFPSAEALTEDAALLTRDVAAIWDALSSNPTTEKILLDQYVPNGPQGAMIGGEWRAWLENICLSCSPSSS